MYAVFYRPDLKPLAEDFMRRYGAVELDCRGSYSHVFILGGDGTLLEALRRHPCLLDAVVVHMGLGRVNFYRSSDAPLSIEEAVGRVERGDYGVLEFSTLVYGDCTALNEFSIYRREMGRLLSFRLESDGGELEGRADGVIVSTPHGASGYVVSTFGPVVDFRAEVVVISFIAPFTLYLRPLVLSAGRVLVETSEDAVLVCDGRESRPGRRFEIRRGDRRLRLAVFGEFRFLNRVLERLRSI
ncbi:NAD(+)/NADH kinase [Pyrobaculum neutrophilum]|uniref:NAD(+)/NADH kinase n=1 Tax=Pyrobaculum neutrophilum TaxID=70771 RepID=UPI00164F834D|nr:NAD(+)/NADH kinase [Pyrobaculum neutrophilum]